MRKLAFLISVLVSGFAIAASPASARAPEIYLDEGGLFSAPWDYAVDGYDVVAYHSLTPDAEPVPGSDEFVAEYKGARWRFASAENLAAFEADPDRYRPQYGGYCAWAVAEGTLAKGDPRQWHVREDKLYLNVNARIKRRWLSDVEDYLARSEKNWPDILDKN